MIVNLLDRSTKVAPKVVTIPVETDDRRLNAPLILSNGDVAVICQFIKVLMPAAGERQTIHMGDKVSGTALVPMPAPVVQQIPRLRGTRFFIDRNGTLVIVGGETSRAEALITPK